jgi:hypothetical protein
MSRSSFELRLEELRSVSTQVRSAVTNGSFEQRARYRELKLELDRLEQDTAEGFPAEQLQERAEALLAAFTRFQRRIEPGNHAAA